MSNSAEQNYHPPKSNYYYTQTSSNTNNIPNEQLNFTTQQSFISHNAQQAQNYLPNRMSRNGANVSFEQNSTHYQQNQNLRANSTRPRDTFLRRLRSIPKFNGDSYAQLREFIDVTESLFISCINRTEENELYEQILLQVRGEARNVVLSLNNGDWEITKKALIKYFAYLANRDILTSQLENARQYEGE